jgi:hypothetical protein
MTTTRHRASRRASRTTIIGALVAALATLGITGAGPAAAAVGVPVTYQDQVYPSTVVRPTADKPQSKLWYTDGSWWALLVSSDTRVHIYELLSNHTWRDTGTVVDDRLNSTGDARWSNSDRTLVVASRQSGSPLRVTRFSYLAASRSYRLGAGFPVVVNTGGGSESATIDRDTTGRLWVTYTRLSKVFVAHSDISGLTWTRGFTPAVPDVAISADDISSLITFRGSIGVLWSDQLSHAFRFAIHHDGDPDSAWRVENALAGPNLADDHINLKGLSDDPQGRVFAAIKTSQDNAGPNTVLTALLVRRPKPDGTGVWSMVPFGTVADDHTRPMIMIDRTNQELYFFATAPVEGGDIYYKKTSLANPSFAPGRGTRFLDYTKVVNNASGAKDPVTAQSGLVVLASADGVKRYVHAEMQIAGASIPADATAPTAPDGLTATAASTQIALDWSASTDNVGVTGYVVHRDGVDVATTTTTSYVDRDVTLGSTHSYSIAALDAGGNRSDGSAEVRATLPSQSPAGTVEPRGATTAANAGSTIFTMSTPAVAEGDMMLASVDFRGRANITGPSGWAVLRQDVNGTAMKKTTYWRIATAGEPVSYSWVLSGSPATVGTMLTYAGASSAAPVADGQVSAASTSIAAPSVTTTVNGSRVIALFGLAQSGAITPPTSLTERGQIASPAGVSFPQTTEASDQTLATPGATGTMTATATISAANIGQLVILAPSS